MSTLLVATALLLTQLSVGLQTQSQGSESVEPSVERSNSIRLTGRVTGPKTAPLPIRLFSAAGSTMQAESRQDGTFEFNRVPLGSYTLRAAGFTPVTFTV